MESPEAAVAGYGQRAEVNIFLLCLNKLRKLSLKIFAQALCGRALLTICGCLLTLAVGRRRRCQTECTRPRCPCRCAAWARAVRPYSPPDTVCFVAFSS